MTVPPTHQGSLFSKSLPSVAVITVDYPPKLSFLLWPSIYSGDYSLLPTHRGALFSTNALTPSWMFSPSFSR